MASYCNCEKTILNIIQELVYDVSPAWRLAAEQYKYFSNPENGYINGDVLTVTKNNISSVARNGGIQPGDLLYFSSAPDKLPYHATIITDVNNDEIYYSGHTKSRFDYPLSASIGDETVFIIRIFDEAE